MKRTYQTEQRKQLLAFLRQDADKQFTIEEIAACLKGPEAPGKSTVYRLMNKLVDEGLVRRFAKENSRQFLYQLMDGEHCDSHLHLKCVCCGKLIHLDDDTSTLVQKKILEKNHFEIDESKILLFGKCESCRLYKKFE